MACVVLRKVTILKTMANCQSFSRQCVSFCSSRAPTLVLGSEKGDSVTNDGNRFHLSPLFSENNNEVCVKDCGIELVDDEAWQVSSGIAGAWRGNDEREVLETKPFFGDQDDDYNNGVVKVLDSNKGSTDFDEIEDMRIRGSLFYKLDKDSKEYDEYKFDFHGRKNSKNQEKNKENKEHNYCSCKSVFKNEKTSKKDELKDISKKNVKRLLDNQKENKENKKQDHYMVVSKIEKTSKKDKLKDTAKTKVERLWGIDNYDMKEFYKNKGEILVGIDENEHLISHLHNLGDYFVGKTRRSPTFNQLTAPYHEPFCLDIYISKGSVRASIIHRVTSKVMAVAHSISKDMKFDLGSTKNSNACAAVGEVLAMRALADDIHNAVYTPRKGEKLEGKLQIVLKSIIDNGIDVKVKLKAKKIPKNQRP